MHDIEIKFFHAEPNKALYTVMKSPPDNAAFMAETDIVSISGGFIESCYTLRTEQRSFNMLVRTL